MNNMNDQQFQAIFTLITDVKSDMKDFKSDMNRRFEQVDTQIKEVKFEIKDIRVEIKDIRGDMKDIRGEMKTDRNKLQEVYESRNRVEVSFTRSWAMASFFISISSSAVVLTLSRLF